MSKPRPKIRPKKPKECGNKRRFETKEEADAAAYRPWSKLAITGYMQSYKCRICKKWHYGIKQ